MKIHTLKIAITDYSDLPRPSSAQKMQFADLINGYSSKISKEEWPMLCRAFARCHNLPQSVVECICTLPHELCRSFLINSRQINDAFIHKLLMTSFDVEKVRCVARNPAIDGETSRLLRSFNNPKIDRALDLRQNPEKKERANTSNQLEIEYLEAPTTLKSINDENDTVLRTEMADHLGLSMQSVNTLCSDATSRNLPTALKYMRLAEDDAWLLYQRLTTMTSQDAEIEIAFRRAYNSITSADAASVVSKWQIDELVSIIKTSTPANDSSALNAKKYA